MSSFMHRTGAAVIVAIVGAAAWAVITSGETAVVAGPSSGFYTPAGPYRVFDSRPGLTAAGATVSIATQIPPGSSAVAVNITLTQNAEAGFATAWNGLTPLPTASIANTFVAGMDVANFALIPVAPNGSFAIYTNKRTGILVDVMGYVLPSDTTQPVPSGLSARITGYGPVSTITQVVGDVTNGTAGPQDVRVDVLCPNGTVETDNVFDIASGDTLGWSVLCDGNFTAGATVSTVRI